MPDIALSVPPLIKREGKLSAYQIEDNPGSHFTAVTIFPYHLVELFFHVIFPGENTLLGSSIVCISSD
jgi:hypothetical protein